MSNPTSLDAGLQRLATLGPDGPWAEVERILCAMAKAHGTTLTMAVFASFCARTARIEDENGYPQGAALARRVGAVAKTYARNVIWLTRRPL